jgi:hypothetical protein
MAADTDEYWKVNINDHNLEMLPDDGDSHWTPKE